MSEKLRKRLNNIIKDLPDKKIYLNDLKTLLWANKDFRTDGQLANAVSYLESQNIEILDESKIKEETIEVIEAKEEIKEEPNEELIDEFDNNDTEEIDITLFDEFIDEAIKEEEAEKEEAKSNGETLSYSNFSTYLKDLNNVDTSTLNQEQEAELALRAQQGDEKAYNELIEHNLKLVISIAKKYISYIGGVLSIDDLVQEGNIGLMKAAQKFDPTLGYKFSTYATWWIRQGILRSISNDSRTIRLPVHLIEVIMVVKKYQKSYSSEHGGEDPTYEQIAHYINVNGLLKNGRKSEYKPSDIESAMNYWNNSTLISLSKPVGEDEDGELGDFIPSPMDTPQKTVEINQLGLDLNKVINKILTDKEAMIIRYRFGFNNKKPMTLDQLGQLLGVSRERIRQIESKALRKLRVSQFSKNMLTGYMEEL